MNKEFIYQNTKLNYFQHDIQAEKTILIIHGFSADINYYLPVFQPYLNEYNVIGIDMPAHGQSDYNESLMNFKTFREILLNFIRFINPKKLIVIGHSMGGGLATAIYPELKNIIEKVVVIGPMNRSSLAVEKEFKEAFFPRNIKEYEKLVDLVYYDPKTIKNNNEIMSRTENYLKTNAQKLDYVYKLGYDLPRDENMALIDKGLKEIQCPIALFYGEADGIVDLNKISDYYRSFVPNIRIEKIAKSGHSIWIENKEDFERKLNDFINE